MNPESREGQALWRAPEPKWERGLREFIPSLCFLLGHEVPPCNPLQPSTDFGCLNGQQKGGSRDWRWQKPLVVPPCLTTSFSFLPAALC